MSFEKASAHLEALGYGDRIIVTADSSATVERAAEAVGVAPGQIAKTLSFLQEDQPVLIVAEGMARIDNRKYKDTFHCKARMIPSDQVEALVGHGPGGVCPFGIFKQVKVYLDVSLKQHETVYPAAGDDHSAVRLSLADLEQVSGFLGWVDVCK